MIKSDLAQRLGELCRDTPNLEPSLLVSATYDGEKRVAVLKFYHPGSQRVYLWHDNTGHKPYCFTKRLPEELKILEGRSDVVGLDRVEKYDLLNDRQVTLTKIVAADPLAIGGTATEKSIRNLLDDVWEADVKYHENYLYDNQLIAGTYYSIKNGRLEKHSYQVAEQVELALKSLVWDKIAESISGDGEDESRKYITEWAKLLNQPIPSIKRAAMDIEVLSVEDRLPDAKVAENEVIAISFVGSDGLNEALVLDHRRDQGKNEMADHISVRFFDGEKEMLLAAFERMLDYPFIITFNGDDFDMPYLYNRAKNLGISKDEIPITMQRDAGSLRHGVHIDLYRTFSNRSVQIYAFGHKYSEYTLNAVSEALLGESKIEFDGGLGDLPLYELARYCHNDSRLTFNLTSFSNDLLMKLLVVVCRVGRMPIDDISRFGVSQWIRSMLYFEHRRQNVLMPKREELQAKGQASTTAVIKDKKYRGGFVVEPEAGVHFNVAVLDFASLYPSIIKVHNLSYETVRCVHDECRSNLIPETEHWVCKKRHGMESLLIGSLRDLRVNYYKHLAKEKSLSKEEKELYTIISQALKVILNASYGVMGAEIFPLYFLPVAEATASIGRYTITRTIDKCKDLGIRVIYGDTDSLFLKGPSAEQIEAVSAWARQELGVDLDLDKMYRYAAFSERKKNYLGVLLDGSVDIKGLTGKKSHTPQFIRDAFYAVVDILSNVKTEADFEDAREKIKKIVKENATKIKAREIPLPALAFNVMVGKSPKDYRKTIPQHIRAAQLLEKAGKGEIRAGDIISFVKTTAPPGVKPVQLARSDEIDTEKYLEYMESTFDQILSALGYEFDVILGASKLEDFFFTES